MAISRAELEQHLDALGLRYGAHDEASLLLGFETERYRNPEGEGRLIVAIRLDEGGEYVSFHAPGVFVPGAEHLDVFLRACMIAQWESKMIQFEYDRQNGEVAAIIEFPVEDATLTERQVRRCVFGLVNLLDEFYTPLARAAEDGVLDFSSSDDLRIENLAQFLAGFPPEVLAEALARADAKMRGQDEPGPGDDALGLGDGY